jgi:hypothetical protein
MWSVKCKVWSVESGVWSVVSSHLTTCHACSSACCQEVEFIMTTRESTQRPIIVDPRTQRLTGKQAVEDDWGQRFPEYVKMVLCVTPLDPCRLSRELGCPLYSYDFQSSNSTPRWIDPWRCTGWPCNFPRLQADPGLAKRRYSLS